MTETPESIALLRIYFEAHEAALQAVTGARFAECMAAANQARIALQAMADDGRINVGIEPPRSGRLE